MLVQRDRNIFRWCEANRGITALQAWKLYFNVDVNGKRINNGKDLAQKRLKKLYEDGFLRRYTNTTTKELIYALKNDNRVLSGHWVYVLDFYAELIYQGCKIIDYKHEPRFIFNDEFPKGKYGADAIFEYEFNSFIDTIILEVDHTHANDIRRYKEIKEEGTLSAQYEGIFPLVVVMSDLRKTIAIEGVKVVYIDYKLSDIKSILWGDS